MAHARGRWCGGRSRSRHRRSGSRGILHRCRSKGARSPFGAIRVLLVSQRGEIVPEIFAFRLEALLPAAASSAPAFVSFDEPVKLVGRTASASLEILTDLGGVKTRLSRNLGFSELQREGS
jgi:hypothetical protein